MLSRALKRYYEPLRLPPQPAAISFPYTHRLMLLKHHCTGPPALHCLSSTTCHPCYPGRPQRPLPFSKSLSTGLPQTSTGSASSSSPRGYIWVHSRYGLLLCQLETYDPLLPGRHSLELPRRTDNSPDGTLTRKTNSCYCERTLLTNCTNYHTFKKRYPRIPIIT